MKDKVLVTGAGGFIGSHLTEALVRQGYEVRAFVHYNARGSNGWLDCVSNNILSNVEIFSGDLRDPHGVDKAVSGCRKILHLGALIGIPYSYHSPDTYLETNIRGTLNILQAARRNNIARLIHTSTSEVYGSAVSVPMNENHRILGQSPYSASKIAADQLAYSFYASFGLPVVTVRPFNAYGPRQSLRAVIPTIICQMLSNDKVITLGNTNTTRDFTFVEDTVEGFISILRSDLGLGSVFNLGSSFEVEINDLAVLIGETLGRELTFVRDHRRVRPADSEVQRLWCDSSNALNTFGWHPKQMGLEGLKTGLVKTIEWFSDPSNYGNRNPNLYTL